MICSAILVTVRTIDRRGTRRATRRVIRDRTRRRATNCVDYRQVYFISCFQVVKLIRRRRAKSRGRRLRLRARGRIAFVQRNKIKVLR